MELRVRQLLALDIAEVAYQSRPARKAMLARDDELCVGETDAGWVREIVVRVSRAGTRDRLGVAGAEAAE
jgi:hypothetical protein